MIECCLGKPFSLPAGEAVSLWHNEIEVMCPECGERLVLVLMSYEEYMRWKREKAIAFRRYKLY